MSDEGHTYIHLTYDIDEKDLQKGNRQKIITNALSLFKVEDRDGELMLAIRDDRYGDALYSFAQALMKITDISYLSRESTARCLPGSVTFARSSSQVSAPTGTESPAT